MKSAFSNRVAIWLLLMLVAFIPIRAEAQSMGPDATSLSQSDNDYSATPYRTYAEYALDLLLNRAQGRGIGIPIHPDEYFVGPGDEFTVYFVSTEIDDILCRVNIGGQLFIKSVGPIEVAGVSLREAIQKTKSAIKKNYAGTEFDIQLTDFRFVQINIIGEIVRPGIYYVPAVWRVTEAIDLAGGLLPEASSRKIILRNDQEEFPVDIVRFDAIGDQSANPFVCKGNTIIAPNRRMSDESVSISGLVNQPGIFSLVAGDRLSDFIVYAHGAKGRLADMMIHVSSQNGDITDRLDGASPETADFIPAPDDNIALLWKDNRKTFGTVTIFGEVTRPGRYPLDTEGFSLKDLLTLCGGIADYGCSEMVQIYRLTHQHFTNDRRTNPGMNVYPGNHGFSDGSGGSVKHGLVSFDPRHPRDHSQLILADGDSVYVPRATGMVSVTGAVASPGLIGFHEGKGVDYYLKQAGGLGYDADQDRMVVINPITGGSISARIADKLFDGEMLFVPRKENGKNYDGR